MASSRGKRKKKEAHASSSDAKIEQKHSAEISSLPEMKPTNAEINALKEIIKNSSECPITRVFNKISKKHLTFWMKKNLNLQKRSLLLKNLASQLDYIN